MLLHLWQRKANLSRLMENHDIGALVKERLTVVLDLQKAVLASYAKLLWLMPIFYLRHDIEHITESTAVARPNWWDWSTPNIPTIPTQVTLIVWGSMPLMTMSTTAMTVLDSVDVVHISHESRLSLATRQPLIRWSTFTHFWVVC
jgi:hypothetical protein